MRRRLAGLAAVLFAPLTVHAQAPGTYLATLQTYAITGCVDGVQRYDRDPGAALRPVFGRIACFGGTAQFVLETGGSVEYPTTLRLVGSMTAAFDPGFGGTGIQADPFGSSVAFTYGDGRHELTSFTLAGTPGFRPDGTGVFDFRTVSSPVPAGLATGTIGDVVAAAHFDLAFPNMPPGDGALATITFTATPEPATWTMLAVGGATLLGVARRRRHV